VPGLLNIFALPDGSASALRRTGAGVTATFLGSALEST